MSWPAPSHGSSPDDEVKLEQTGSGTPSPSDLLLLFHCSLCFPSSLVLAPTTLKCGHTVCAEHVMQSSSSDLGFLSSATCQIPSCQNYSSTLTTTTLSNSKVAHAFPALEQRPQVEQPKLPVDFLVCKVISVIQKFSTTEPTGPGFQNQPTTGIRSVSSALLELRRDESAPLVESDHPYLSSSRFREELLCELTCEICLMLLYQPITTPCQHTFCNKCIQRSIDHSTYCPICRANLPGFSYFRDHPPNKIILSLILKIFPELYADRKAVIDAEERGSHLDTPIFVCQLSFPGTPTNLHIFEPRYRLMLRRCLEKEKPQFGMILPKRTAHDHVEYGTLLEIRSVRMLPDGRSLIETFGTERFRILESGFLDGYMVGRIEIIEDSLFEEFDSDSRSNLPPEFLSSLNSHRTYVELLTICRSFLERLPPWVWQRILQVYGPEPEDPNAFVFWMALVLPLDDYEKAKLLPLRSPDLRLELVVYWIEQINRTRWFANGCIVS